MVKLNVLTAIVLCRMVLFHLLMQHVYPEVLQAITFDLFSTRPGLLIARLASAIDQFLEGDLIRSISIEQSQHQAHGPSRATSPSCDSCIVTIEHQYMAGMLVRQIFEGHVY